MSSNPSTANPSAPLSPDDVIRAFTITPDDVLTHGLANLPLKGFRETLVRILAERVTRDVFVALLTQQGGRLHHSNPNVSCSQHEHAVDAARANGVLQALIDDGTVEDTGWDIQLQPKVGMPATVPGYSDRYAYTVVKVTPKSAILRRVKATLLNGHNSGEPDALDFSPGGFVGHTSGTQRYKYEEDPEGKTIRITKRKNGAWRTAGAGTGSSRVSFGKHSEYYDHNF